LAQNFELEPAFLRCGELLLGADQRLRNLRELLWVACIEVRIVEANLQAGDLLLEARDFGGKRFESVLLVEAEAALRCGLGRGLPARLGGLSRLYLGHGT